MLNFFPIYFSPKVFHFLFVWCVLHIGLCLPKTVIKFLAVCYIIIIIIIISFIQGIYSYIPETNNVPREYIVAAILLLLIMVPISLVPALALLCFYVSTFRRMCAVPNMAVFCSSLIIIIIIIDIIIIIIIIL
jgi:hypothetical protein